jgi:indole-3-glycerol phosphate synthase
MTHLEEIIAARRRSVELAKADRPIATLRASVASRSDFRRFRHAIRGAGATRVIAEFKRSSPSAGAIAAEADPAAVAADFERAGACAISVLTEPDRFGGGFGDLRAARAATALPVLCKDFVVDDFQVWQAAAEGADALLLIVAALDRPTLARLIALARAVGLAPLVEVHDEQEGVIATDVGADLIGVNNRDLRTFEVDLSTAPRVRSTLPRHVAVVAESGYRTRADVATCGTDIDAVLVGEALMRTADRAGAVRALRGAS